MGNFALPVGDIGTSKFGWNSGAMHTYRDPSTGKMTLFMSGFAVLPGNVAQVELPDSLAASPTQDFALLPQARVLQKFKDVTNGDLSSTTSTLGYNSNGTSVRGLLPHNDKLLLSSVNWWSFTQDATHGVAKTAFTDNSYWSGFSAPYGSITPIRSVAGAMAKTPIDWLPTIGSAALTGASTVSIISTASYGPAISGFDPDSVTGTGAPFKSETLLYYPREFPVCGSLDCDSTANPIFNWTTQIRGFAPVSGSDSILFVGTHGTGSFWYGEHDQGPNGDKDLLNAWKGPHSTIYEYRVWAYKASDLAMVKSKAIESWAIKPYAIIPLKELTDTDPSGRIVGSTFDQSAGMLYVIAGNSEFLRVHVYKIK